MLSFKSLLILALFLLALAPVAPPPTTQAAGNISITRTFQQSASYAGTTDTWVDENAPDVADGNNTTLLVWARPGRVKRALVKFDISSIPTGATAASATLSLRLSTPPNTTRTHNVHRTTATWGETTVTWNTQPSFNATATASADTGTVTATLTWTVTSDVSAWVAGTATNFGWVVKDSLEDTDHRTEYDSEDNPTAANRPKLAVTFTAPWDSHTDSARADPAEDTFASPNTTVYMRGTGFAAGTYNVAYYDGTATGGGNKMATESNISVAADGILNSQYLLTTDPNAVAGSWHALAQPSGATAFPSTYDAAVAAPDTYSLVANDSFTVESSAIPEFPTVVSALVTAGLTLAIYLWMRKRREAYVVA